MSAIVFASTGGRKYHFDQQCRSFESAQQLNDWDTPDDAYLARWAYPTLHALLRMSATKAAMDGKLPCLTCVPAHLREMPPLNGETFGHKPVALASVIHENWTKHSACAACRARMTHLVCARCMEFDANGMWNIAAHPVHWPCTSATVLGLAPHAEQATR